MDAKTQRIDHLGIVAGIIKELNLIEMIDELMPKDVREDISTGEAVAGMILNGLGFSDRPMTLTPQFFENKAMPLLFRPGISSDSFNRFKLGRALDTCYDFGCDQLFFEVSKRACEQQHVDLRFNSLDTTAFALTGEYDNETDEQAIEITYGYSKDHRPDLKQAVLEMMVSQDGGVPLISQAWSGNAADTKVFGERAKAILESFKNSETPRYLVADCKLYTRENIESLGDTGFITRIPGSIKMEGETIEAAMKEPFEEWNVVDKSNRSQTIDVEHYGGIQRWIVIHSKEMKERAEKSIFKAVKREHDDLERQLKKLSKQEFFCEKDAKRVIEDLSTKAKYHTVCVEEVIGVKNYSGKGRPAKDASYTVSYKVSGKLLKEQTAIDQRVKQKSCYVIGTNISRDELDDVEVVKGYKGQNSSVERGFRFLKDPIFFTSSLFLKKPERIQALLMVMTLSLLVYSLAERIMRQYLSVNEKTLPNQIKKEISTPTLRWVFQLMEGVDLVEITINDHVHTQVTGLSELRKRILDCFPPQVRKIYGIAA